MGLDIYAYGKTVCISNGLINGEPINPQTGEVWEDYEDGVIPYANSHYKKQAQGIKSHEYYTYEESLQFWSTGYGFYSSWREELAKLAGYEPLPFEQIKGNPSSSIMSYTEGAISKKSGPFIDLIDFSDCEGSIDSQTCKVLLEDFKKFQNKALLKEEWFKIGYNKWINGLNMAVNEGFLIFT